jgi:gliding motility-associated-like protein
MYARGFGIKKLLHFKIFNRWGQLLFFTQDEKNGWDGYYKGELQPVDTYFYNVSAESFIPDKILSFEGNFLLLK